MSENASLAALKPCPNPWCEWADRMEAEPGADYRPQITYSNFGLCYVACTSCTMAGPTRQHEIEAISAWNTRAADQRCAELEAERDKWREAVLAVVAATRGHLPPDGITAHECISRVLEATDNPVISPMILAF